MIMRVHLPARMDCKVAPIFALAKVWVYTSQAPSGMSSVARRSIVYHTSKSMLTEIGLSEGDLPKHRRNEIDYKTYKAVMLDNEVPDMTNDQRVNS